MSLIAKINGIRINGTGNCQQNGFNNGNEFDLLKKDYDDGFSSTNGTVDTAFKLIKPNTTGFHIWKIESTKVVSLPKDQYGIFYDTNAYIVYAASEYGQRCGTDSVDREVHKGTIECHIHFWLGVSATSEKSGIAAYKTVELDAFIGGISTQHREFQEHESPRFKSYFKNGMRILKHPYEGELNQNSDTRLFKIKCNALIELERVSWDLMNSETVYALNTVNHLFLWIGRSSNAVDKIHSIKIANQLRTEKKCYHIVFVDDGYEQTLDEKVKGDFNKHLPLSKRTVQPHEPAECKDKDKTHAKHPLRTYKCTDNNGRYRVAEVKTGPLNQSDLDTNDVYILDHGRYGIWVWVGKKAKEREKAEALRNARGFVKKKNYPNYTRVTRVLDGNEPSEFKFLFSQWRDKNDHTEKTMTKLIGTNVDVDLLQERTSLAAECQLLDDGAGTIKAWRVKKRDLVQITKENQGIFVSDGAYIVVYAYNNKRRGCKDLIIYTWMGNEANQEDIEGAFINKDEINRELGGSAVLVTITENNEPPHFLQIFQGKMLILKTPSANGDGRSSPLCNTYLLQVFGSTKYTSKAVQVPMASSSLDSNYCYILKQLKNVYIWCGIYSTGDQREMAKGFAGKSFEIVLEKKETETFWEILGGSSLYKTEKISTDVYSCRPAKLYRCYWDSLPLKAEEIFNFTQSDLLSEHVLLLDAYSAVFLWLGKLSSKRKDTFYMKNILEHLKQEGTYRNINIPIIQVLQGNEPIIFTGFFKTWNDSFWDEYKGFDKLREEIESDEKSPQKPKLSPRAPSDKKFDQYPKYSVETLKLPNEKIPDDVDLSRKELHLTHDDFVEIFRMNYDNFSSLPKWKQQELKKGVGLF
ncbi:advillin isoform X2 [Agrilus planipennis]|uniref:Advillin isoform X2 n=1 Tax=Agrilus planipennis TaxID=224129 RepID=A0A7F5R2D5_AGRPL|nr:advillin isoform X2 [Agrilus planipennis]